MWTHVKRSKHLTDRFLDFQQDHDWLEWVVTMEILSQTNLGSITAYFLCLALLWWCYKKKMAGWSQKLAIFYGWHHNRSVQFSNTVSHFKHKTPGEHIDIIKIFTCHWVWTGCHQRRGVVLVVLREGSFWRRWSPGFCDLSSSKSFIWLWHQVVFGWPWMAIITCVMGDSRNPTAAFLLGGNLTGGAAVLILRRTSDGCCII